MAISIYDQNILPTWAQQAVNNIQVQWQAATKSGDKKKAAELHTAAEAIRAQSGYSGGDWGNKFIDIGKAITDRVINMTTPTASTGTGTVVGTATDDPIIPAPMTANFQRVLTIGLGVLALGFIANMFSRKG